MSRRLSGCGARNRDGDRPNPQRTLDDLRMSIPGNSRDHASGRQAQASRGRPRRPPGQGARGRQDAIGRPKRTRPPSGDRLEQNRLGPTRRVRGTALIGARQPEIDGVSIEPHTHSGIGAEVIDGPRRRYDNPHPAVAHHPPRGSRRTDRNHAPGTCRQQHQSANTQRSCPHARSVSHRCPAKAHRHTTPAAPQSSGPSSSQGFGLGAARYPRVERSDGTSFLRHYHCGLSVACARLLRCRYASWRRAGRRDQAERRGNRTLAPCFRGHLGHGAKAARESAVNTAPKTGGPHPLRSAAVGWGRSLACGRAARPRRTGRL